MKRLVIIGAGGFGRECHDVVVAMNAVQPQWDFVGFVDDRRPDPDLLARIGADWIGGTEDLGRLGDVSYVVGVGDPAIRRGLAHAADSQGLTAATLIHPSATFGLDVEVGGGSVICAHVGVTTNVRIGRHVHIDQSVTVGHDVKLGDYARVNPGAAISGAVDVGEGALVGARAVVLQGLSVMGGATVGAGAVVTRSVSGPIAVVGVPARAMAGSS